MSKDRRSNVVPIRQVKTYRQMWEEAGRPDTGGLKMMADAEDSGDLAKQLGYVADDADPDRSGS